jgi:hypothetical protein
MSEIIIIGLVIVVIGLMYYYRRLLAEVEQQKKTIDELRQSTSAAEKEATHKLGLALTLANANKDRLGNGWRMSAAAPNSK